MSRRLSKRRLLETLKDLLESPQVKVQRRKLKREHGLVYYERTPGTNELKDIKIVLDSRNTPVVSTVIHELLHLHMAQHHNIDRLFATALEEAMVKGLEMELEGYLHDPKNERLFQSWVRAVEFKLK